ncbi:hypothetical protein [Nonomuraea sp. NPDC050202]|uniref:hypothetical protein n=1 Tax=Nonomuraea sp. NPDC050202 TaxID=3155035 RepID=UPI0033E7E419
MSDGYPTAAQKEALRLICGHEPMPAYRLADELVAARRPSTNPGYARDRPDGRHARLAAAGPGPHRRDPRG